MQEIIETKGQKFILDYDEAKKAINELKKILIAKGEASELFGNKRIGAYLFVLFLDKNNIFNTKTQTSIMESYFHFLFLYHLLQQTNFLYL